MGKKITLTESEFHALVRRLVKETQDEMMTSDIDIEDEEAGGDELSKGEVVDLISKFFKHEVLPELGPDEKQELRHEVSEGKLHKLSDMYLNEDLGDRMASFKEKAMIKGGLGMAALGAVGAVSQFMGWSETETMAKIHDFVQSFGGGEYTGPITVAMVAAGLALALRGRAKQYSRLGQ
jgi:hypothetical protein